MAQTNVESELENLSKLSAELVNMVYLLRNLRISLDTSLDLLLKRLVNISRFLGDAEKLERTKKRDG
jgi:hypothetical protein